jgi:1,4-alpha-glucan branching enzyme
VTGVQTCALPISAPGTTATESTGPVQREALFNIAAPNARDIYLVGDFNHWKMNDESRLSRLDDGRWEKKLGLTPGRYKYKFVVDGEWVLDTQNNEREQNSFGTFDSVINL